MFQLGRVFNIHVAIHVLIYYGYPMSAWKILAIIIRDEKALYKWNHISNSIEFLPHQGGGP